MDTNSALWLSKARMSELHAEAAANRLAGEARRTGRAQSRRRAVAADDHNRADARPIESSWIARLWALLLRAMPVLAADPRP